MYKTSFDLIFQLWLMLFRRLTLETHVVGFDTFANIFDVLVRNLEAVTPFLQRDFAVAVRVALVKEVPDAVFQWFQRRDKWKQLRSADDSVFGAIHLTKFPQDWHDFWVFGAAGASVHIGKFDFQLFSLVQSLHHVGQPQRHAAGKCNEFIWFTLSDLFAG